MADSTPLLAQIAAGQAQKEVTANGLFDAASPATAYGRHAETCVGLTWGYYGTRYGGSTVASGTNVCGASTTTYMVVNLNTGAVSFATSTTNWDDAATYGRAYKIVTGTDSVTSYEDHRFGPLGLFGRMAVAMAAGKRLSVSNTLTMAGTDGTTMTFPPASASIGYLNIPQNSQSTAYTTVAADAGKHLLHPSADTTPRTFTIDSNANVPYPVGTAITFINEDSAGALTIAITSDTMRLAGAGTTGSRTLAANGVATAIKVTSTSWIISGTGLS